jgi:cholesterol transport system auxiliary component
MKSWSAAAASLTVALALTACSGSLLQSNAEAPETYRLHGPALADRGGRLPLALAVARPRAAAALDTDRVAVVRTASRFDYFAGVRWSEPAPQILQQLLVNAFTADGRFAAVVAAPSRVPADLSLDVELRRFEADYPADGAAPEVRVEMLVTLIEMRPTRRVASFLAVGTAVAAENRRAAVVAAFEVASAQAVESAVSQVRGAPLPAGR